jgi:RNA polymerase sigma factor (TIGR02999 family)
MRQILVDHARSRWAAKRAALTIPLNEAISFQKQRGADLLALDFGLSALEKLDARKCKVVELRYFAGLSINEIGKALDISAVTVRRDLRMAEAWLHKEMRTE